MTFHDGPRVYLVARTQADRRGMQAYLDDIGAPGWLAGHEDQPDPELLGEFGGRMCYRAWEPGLNPNISKVRGGSTEYLRNILGQRHGSVLEHATWSFVFHQVSRVFTEELLTHRPGTAKSQESLRYVRLEDIPMWLPEWAGDDPEVREQAENLLARMSWFQRYVARRWEIDAMPFAQKKRVTSFMRRLAPLGLSTGVVWTANARALRHVIEARTADGAEEEMRLVFGRVAEIMREEAPALFGDFTEKDGAWVPEWSKV